MEYKEIPFDKRINENIRNYAMDNLYPVGSLTAHLKALAAVTGVELLLTDRHGEKIVSVGNFAGFVPDVVGEPGRKVRIYNRTVAHLYAKTNSVEEDRLLDVERMLDVTVIMLSYLSEEAYLHRESAIYMDELEERLEERHTQASVGRNEDVLTGVYHKFYFEERMNVIARSGICLLYT